MDINVTQEQYTQFLKDATADGFVGKIEPRNFRIEQQGFVIHGDTLKNGESLVAGWGPDGMVVDVPIPYDRAKLIYNLSVCSYCGKESEVVRIGFAGRCCKACHKKHVLEVEYPGWTK